jgi:hypothetical protein
MQELLTLLYKSLSLALLAVTPLCLAALPWGRVSLLLSGLGEVGDAATTIEAGSVLVSVDGCVDILGCARELGVVGIVLGHVAGAASTCGVVVALEGRGDEVVGLDMVIGVIFADVAWGLLEWVCGVVWRNRRGLVEAICRKNSLVGETEGRGRVRMRRSRLTCTSTTVGSNTSRFSHCDVVRVVVGRKLGNAVEMQEFE